MKTARRKLGLWSVLAVALLLLGGLVRAATSRYEQQEQAIYAQCAAEQKRLGLTKEKLGDKYRETLFAKYPTPEITLCPFTRAVPGSTGEIVVKGKFAPGTRFLFKNDNIAVVKEALTASEYRTSIKLLQAAGPGLAHLTAWTPVSCGTNECLAIYIGGKYDWDFTASNGWRIKLRMLDEDFTGKERSYRVGEAQELPHPFYCAEYYRGGEAKPFAVRAARFNFGGNYEVEASADACDVKRQEKQETQDTQAELEKLMQKMMNPNLSDKERERLMARYEELSQKREQELRANLTKMMDPKEIQKQEEEKKKKEEEKKKKLAEICRSLAFRPAESDGLEGTAYCDDWKLAGPGRYGRMPLKGTMKYVGP